MSSCLLCLIMLTERSGVNLHIPWGIYNGWPTRCVVLHAVCRNSCQYTCIHVWQVELECWCQWWKKQLQLVKEPGDEGCSCWPLKAVDCWLLKAVDCWLLKTIRCHHGGPRSVATAASCWQASVPCVPGGQSPGCGYPSSVPVVCLLHACPWHSQWIEICWEPLHCAA